jgi:hypothetical protein
MLLLAGIKIILEVHVNYTCSVCLLSVLCTLSTMQICHCCRHLSSNRVINCQLNFSMDKLFDVFKSLLIFFSILFFYAEKCLRRPCNIDSPLFTRLQGKPVSQDNLFFASEVCE